MQSGSKLTEKDVRMIRVRASNGEYYSHIAKDYDMEETAISRAARRITWSHVE